MKNAFFKGHGLGNDYLAMNPKELDFALTPANIRTICDRHRGIGSDGILALVQSSKADFGRKIFILIWERGAGETQASGSSACAAASAAVRLGLVKSPVAVKAPGGTLRIDVDADFHITMKGPVAEVARGTLSPSFLRTLR